MTQSRRVYVFHRSDGKCIHENNWDDRSPSAASGPLEPIPASTLWPLIQVFVQFAREVQGGSVKRLVFKTPADYAPTVTRFQPMPQSPKSSATPSTVIHVAHNDLFAVAVTEHVPLTHQASALTAEESDQAPVFTISDFCESLLDFLNHEQAAYLATLTSEDKKSPAQDPGTSNRVSEELDASSQNTLPSSSRQPSIGSSSESLRTASHSDLSQYADEEAVPNSTSARPVVEINESRLSEFVSKTQNLLRY